uniref:Uncharacterized protein n=1 Tax=Elphidium margaritaceum TaxID=933848 RepID=A0A7S0TF34_9EUKA|mmetsp:Transcript_306/g.494  ORF Transcript_306/g.494 Transcript_306/m.494 type:complete len:232 (+) Transcript_306:161-856(+)
MAARTQFWFRLNSLKPTALRYRVNINRCKQMNSYQSHRYYASISIRKSTPTWRAGGACIFGVCLSFGTYRIMCNPWFAHAAVNNYNPSSQFNEKQWMQVAEEINHMGHNLRKSTQVRWYEYIAVIGSFFVFGLGILLWPLYKYRLHQRAIKSLKIGPLRCRLKGTLRSYLFDVVLYYVLFTIMTVGIYPLFGFAYIHEAHWFDVNTEWFVPTSHEFVHEHDAPEETSVDHI